MYSDNPFGGDCRFGVLARDGLSAIDGHVVIVGLAMISRYATAPLIVRVAIHMARTVVLIDGAAQSCSLGLMTEMVWSAIVRSAVIVALVAVMAVVSFVKMHGCRGCLSGCD